MFFSPKKTGVHAKFNPSWIKKNIRGIFLLSFFLLFKNKNNEKNIIMYKTIQTGVKIQSGGFKKGLFKLSNQSMFSIYL